MSTGDGSHYPTADAAKVTMSWHACCEERTVWSPLLQLAHTSRVAQERTFCTRCSRGSLPGSWTLLTPSDERSHAI